MTQNLADAPLVWRIAMQRLFFGNCKKERQRFFHLGGYFGENVVVGDAVDVGEIIRRGFTCFWTSNHGSSIAKIRRKAGFLLAGSAVTFRFTKLHGSSPDVTG